MDEECQVEGFGFRFAILGAQCRALGSRCKLLQGWKASQIHGNQVVHVVGPSSEAPNVIGDTGARKRGTLFWGPYNKDPTIQDAILGSPIFGNSHTAQVTLQLHFRRACTCGLHGDAVSPIPPALLCP